MDYLFTHFKNKHHNCICKSFIAAWINITWNKFVQYYAMTNNMVAYFFVTAFNFIYKWNYFDKHWKSMPKLQKNLWQNKQNMQHFWKNKYKFQTAQVTTKFVFNQNKCFPNGFINWIQQQMNKKQIDKFFIYFNKSCLQVNNSNCFKLFD